MWGGIGLFLLTALVILCKETRVAWFLDNAEFNVEISQCFCHVESDLKLASGLMF